MASRRHSFKRPDSAPRGLRPDRALAGFTLVEALLTLTISTIAILGAVGVHTSAIRDVSTQAKEFVCLSIAQQNVELLSSVPSDSDLLKDTAQGSVYDGSNTVGVDGPDEVDRQVNALGDVDTGGQYTVYWKTAATGVGDTRRHVVYCSFIGPTGEKRVFIETIR